MKGELLFNIDSYNRIIKVSNVKHRLCKTIALLASTLNPVLTSCGFRSIRWKIDDENTICIRKVPYSRFDFIAYFVR